MTSTMPTIGKAPPTFVVSSGRCGSTLLSNILRSHPSVLSLSELLTVLGGARLFEAPPADGTALWRAMTNPQRDLTELLDACPDLPEFLYRGKGDVVPPLLLITLPHLCAEPEEVLRELEPLVRALPRGSAGSLLSRLFACLQHRFGRATWVERSGGSLEYVDAILQAWPTARVVHMVRNGPDTARSMARHPFFRIKLARFLARDPALPVRECLGRHLPAERFGAYWSALMLRWQAVAPTIPRSKRLVLHYERLLAAPEAELRRLAGFLELPDAEAWAATNCRHVRPGRRDGLPRDARLERSCRPGMWIAERLN